MKAPTEHPKANAEPVLPLDRLSAADLDLAGGKAANLGELVRAGFPVPPGFAVATAAYDRFVAHSGLHSLIARSLGEQPDSGAAIRAAFEAAPIPPEVAGAVLAAYAQLGQGPVAVRSSATAEDLPQAAFAGQQDTFLNVVGADALVDALRRCWASLWTDRAVAYRQRLGLDQQAVKIAVVVQRMAAAEAAGVLFTANTVTGARDEMVIAASPGLGEAVVSGQVTPDHFVLRRRRWGWRIVERRAGRRELIVRPRPDGGVEHVEGAAAAATAAAPALPDRALRRLARLGAAIERHFGRPQDVEWAWANGELSILQARPITALPEPPPRPGLPMQMLAGIFAEIMPARLYPLEFTTWGPHLLVASLLGPMFRVLGLATDLDRAIVEEEGVAVRLTGRFPVHPTPATLPAPLRLARLARRYDPARWRDDPLLAEALARVRVLEACDLRRATWPGLLDAVREALAIPYMVGELRARYLLPRAPAMAGLLLMLTLLGERKRFGALLFTGIESRTMDANRALEALAARVRTDPILAHAFAHGEAGELWAALEAQPAGRAFLAGLRAFLDEYGHREVGGTLQVSQPTWSDAPEVVLGILKGLAAAPPPPGSGPPAWEVARDEALAHPLLRIPPLRAAFLKLLAGARWFPLIREDTRFYATTILPSLRRALLEMGRRTAGAGVLDDAQDVFHLRLEELERIGGAWPPSPQLAGELRALAARRKAKRAELENIPFVDPRLFQPAAALGDALLRGIPGSPGVAEGPVRIVNDGSEFGRLRPGEVLVAPYTNPAWTPLFQWAAAVVVDSGGPGSHAAIVAREYGIPAVMGVITGTRTLADGERVRVDGSQGAVFRVE